MNKRPFRIIPVLDLKDGIVVHGVQGERDNYKPIESTLTSSAEFTSVMDAFLERIGLKEFYVADLDAITTRLRKHHLHMIDQEIASRKSSTSLSLMVDAGVYNTEGVGKVLEYGVDKVIIGTETLPSFSILKEIIKEYGLGRILVSIDTKNSQVLSPSQYLARLTPPEAIKAFRNLGVKEFILLELGRVGTGRGLNHPLIMKCVTAVEDSNSTVGSLIIGGGVSGYEDLKWLAQAGVSGALVATTLHKGQINSDMIRSLAVT